MTKRFWGFKRPTSRAAVTTSAASYSSRMRISIKDAIDGVKYLWLSG